MSNPYVFIYLFATMHVVIITFALSVGYYPGVMMYCVTGTLWLL